MTNGPFPPIEPVDLADQESRLRATISRGRQLRRRRAAVAVVAAAALAAAVTVPVLTAGGSEPSRNVEILGGPSTTRPPVTTSPPPATTSPPGTTTSSSTETSSVPPGFVIESFTAVSPSRWWVLGNLPCGVQRCTEIAATSDGGASFAMLPGPGGPYGSQPAAQAPATAIRFANPRDGWAWGSKLYSTHDGGHHWTPITVPGQVTEMESGSDRVFAVITPPIPGCSTSGTCSDLIPGSEIWRTSPGSDSWEADPAGLSVSGAMAVHGRSVWIINSVPTKDGPAAGIGLLYSSDDGDHFITQPQPVSGVTCGYQPVSTQMLWAYCSGGHFMFVYRSTDAGAHFTLTDNGETVDANGCPNGSQLAAASQSVAVAACDLSGQPLLQTSDSGTTWHVVQPALNPDGSWEPIGFTTAVTGYALWQELSGQTPKVQLWRTTNGGSSWDKVQAFP